MYSALSAIIENSDESLVVYKNFKWKSEELFESLKSSYQILSLESEESWSSEKLLVIDSFDEQIKPIQDRLERIIYDADRVLYLKNPFVEDQKLEEVLLASGKSLRLISLLGKSLKNLYFLRFSLFSPRFRVYLSALLDWVAARHESLDVIRIEQSSNQAFLVFEQLSERANRPGNCYILGMKKPKGWAWLQKG